jgi:type IV secretion system protein VirD4
MAANRVAEVVVLWKQYAPLVRLYTPYVVWGLCSCMLLLMLLKSLWRRGRCRGGKARDAHWASWRDLRKAYLLGEIGIVLGHIGGWIVRYWGRGHVFIVAATQTGKSMAIVKPTLLEAQPRGKTKVMVLVNDPKNELYECTQAYRRTISRVIHLAPMDPTTDHYNPLDAIRLGTVHETADVQLLEKLLVNPEGKPIHNEASRHYVENTETVTGGLLTFGLMTGLATSLGEFYIVTTQGELDKVFTTMATFDHPRVREAGYLMKGLDEQQYSGIVSTVKRVFRLYADPVIGAMVSYSDFALDDLRQGAEPLSLYLSIPFEHLERLRPLTCLLFQQWLGRASAAPANWAKLGWHRVLGIGEEFPSLKHLNIAQDILNQGAGLGVQLCLITPSLNAITDIWGAHHNFLDNTHVQAFFGITDASVARTVSERLGTQMVVKRRETWTDGRQSLSEEWVKEPLMDVSAITHMDPNDILLLARNHQVIVQQTPWDQWQPWAARGCKT